MILNKIKYSLPLIALLCLNSCGSDDGDSVIPVVDTYGRGQVLEDTCTTDQVLDDTRGVCDQTLTENSEYDESISGTNRIIVTNSIPDHDVGLFGRVPDALNPNAITVQNQEYTITTVPEEAASLTPLSTSTGIDYSFGILFNGVELDPVAAEPFPHEGVMSANVNWDWNLEALNVNLGLDCNNAHVQPTGRYHYHGSPTMYLDNLDIQDDEMTLIGYAADGFPIYYKYSYRKAGNKRSSIIEMTSSYQLKTGNRPGDGITAPCDVYNGIYSADYEYIEGLGTLDEANGRTGVTPEYPSGTYYYVLTDSFPVIPRYFKGTPSSSFDI